MTCFASWILDVSMAARIIITCPIQFLKTSNCSSAVFWLSFLFNFISASSSCLVMLSNHKTSLYMAQFIYGKSLHQNTALVFLMCPFVKPSLRENHINSLRKNQFMETSYSSHCFSSRNLHIKPCFYLDMRVSWWRRYVTHFPHSHGSSEPGHVQAFVCVCVKVPSFQSLPAPTSWAFFTGCYFPEGLGSKTCNGGNRLRNRCVLLLHL